MKKLIMCLLIVVNTFTLLPTNLKAIGGKTTDSLTITQPIDSSNSKELLARLEEIKAMDMSAMSRVEKKELRNEVRATKKQLRENDGGIYLSVGAIIIIVLLLIILL